MRATNACQAEGRHSSLKKSPLLNMTHTACNVGHLLSGTAVPTSKVWIVWMICGKQAPPFQLGEMPGWRSGSPPHTKTHLPSPPPCSAHSRGQVVLSAVARLAVGGSASELRAQFRGSPSALRPQYLKGERVGGHV